MNVQVPKMLGVLKHVWAPEAFVVSFKLETDENILLKKVQPQAVHHYSMACACMQLWKLRTEQNSIYKSCHQNCTLQ